MGKRKDGTEHVVMDQNTGDWCCQHCHERRSGLTGQWLPLSVFLAKMQGFILLHRDCRPERESGG